MIRILPLAALLAATTALSACNLAPDYQRPVGSVSDLLPQGGPYPRADSDAPDISTIGWRDFFVDPRLQGTIALALENNRDLRIAAANVLQARAQYRIQRADQLPTVGVNAGATITKSPFGLGGAGAGGGAGLGTGAPGTGTGGTGTGTGTGAGTGTGGAGGIGGVGVGGASGSSTIEIYSVNVGVSQFEVDLFGRVRNLSTAALERYFASEEAQRATRISLIAEVATAWLQLAADRDQLATARVTLESFRQSLDLTRAQFRIGVISELEVQQSETLFQAARNDIAALQTRIAQDQNALNLLVGTTVGVDLQPDALGSDSHTLSSLPAGISSTVLLRRPDVLQAEHQLIAENANIGAARAALFPTISLTATLGTISTALSGLFGSGSDTFNVAPGASLPIFDFGRRRANIRYSEATQQVALNTYERTLQTAFREVADALAARGTIGEQVAAREARARAAETAARLSDARYRAGVESFLGSLDAQRTAYAARQDLVTTRLARSTNLVALYRTLGGGLSEVGGTPAADMEPSRP